MKQTSLLLCVFILLFSGCSKSNQLSDTVLTSEQLKYFITYSNNVTTLDTYILTDKMYRIPKEAWITEKLQPAVAEELYNHNNRTAVEERNDCDNFVLYARAVACTINNKDNKTETEIAVGEYAFINEVFGGHDVLMIVVEDKNKQLKMVLWDPFDSSFVPFEPNGQSGAGLFWRF